VELRSCNNIEMAFRMGTLRIAKNVTRLL